MLCVCFLAVEATESQSNDRSDKKNSSAGQSQADATQHVLTLLQDAWWTYIGLPLHFRASRVVGFAKALIQQSVFVAWESTRIAPKRFEWWMKRRDGKDDDDPTHSLSLTLLERRLAPMIPNYVPVLEDIK